MLKGPNALPTGVYDALGAMTVYLSNFNPNDPTDSGDGKPLFLDAVMFRPVFPTVSIQAVGQGTQPAVAPADPNQYAAWQDSWQSVQIPVEGEGDRTELHLHAAIDQLFSTTSDWQASLADAPGLDFWSSPTGGSSMTSAQISATFSDGDLDRDIWASYAAEDAPTSSVTLDYTGTDGVVRENASASVATTVLHSPLSLVFSAPTMKQPGVGSPWNANFDFVPNQNGYLIQKVTTDWAYNMQSPAGAAFLGSSRMQTNRLNPVEFPFPYETTNPAFASPLVYYEVWFVKDSKVYADPGFSVAAGTDSFAPSPPVFQLTTSRYYQAGELRWIPIASLPPDGLATFHQPLPKGPSGRLWYATTVPSAWNVGTVVATRAWGYTQPSVGMGPLPWVPNLNDGDTGWTATGNYRHIGQ
jgi:hypothetical protein